MPRPTAIAFCLAVLVATAAGPAAAYIGPGAGITMLGALWGVVVAVVLALAAVLLWPIRAFLRSRRKAQPAAAAGHPSGHDAAAATAARDEAR